MPSIAIIRYFICCCLLACIAFSASAQKIFEGQVVDKEKETTLPGVTVKLIKENRVTITNGRGYYKLISTDSLANDSLQFSSIGYKTLRMAVSAYQPNMFILLEALATPLKNVSVTDKKKKIPPINKFSLGDIRTNAFNPTLPFYAKYMFAMLSKVAKKNSRITSVRLGRRGFTHPGKPPEYRELLEDPNRPGGYAQFLVHIMSVDARTGKPGEKIYTKQVIVNDNSLMVDVDVSADNWILNTDNFFIAIEWQRIPLNERLITDVDDIVWKTKRNGTQRLIDAPTYSMLYQPTLIAFIDSRKYTAYYADTPGNWQLYGQKLTVKVMGVSVPYNAHIALSATIDY